MSDSFELLVLGVGDAFSETYNHTSFVVMSGGFRLLIDAPEPLPKILREAGDSCGVRVTLDDIDDVVITHLHADHVSGFETYCYHKKYHQGRLGTAHTSPEVAEVLWDQRLRGAMGVTTDVATGKVSHNRPEDYYRLRVLDYGHENAIGPFQVSTRRAIHPIPTIGLVIRLGDVSLGYSCDTAYDPEHIAWLSGCDMILHETGEGLHASITRLAELPGEIRRKLWLVHYRDDHDTGRSPIQCLRQGCLYTVAKRPNGVAKVQCA